MSYDVEKSDHQWRTELSADRYAVLRHASTELPWTGSLLHVDTDGVFTCGGCGQHLFTSSQKFDSGCGWPSYFKPLNGEVIDEKIDYSHGMVRVEVRCNHCGAHLGHVFEDGPRDKTGLRYCINSAALNFESRPEND